MPTRTYATDDLVVEWYAERCVHVARCLIALPEVFDTRKRPWIQPERASTEAIIDAVEQCPTGALRYRHADGRPPRPVSETTVAFPVHNGPLVLRGRTQVLAQDGTTFTEEDRLALCRCGNSGNGTLVILNSNFDNAAGVIRATGSGVVSLQGANIADGPFETEDDGVIQLTTNASGLIGVANNGKIRQPDNADVYLNGDVTNNGTWAMQSAGNPTDVFINAPTVTIGGNGAIEMSDNVQNRFYGTGGVRRLINGPDHTIRGTGQFGLNLNFDLTNSGTLIADQSGGISIDVSNDFLNEGTLQVTGAGAMTIHPGAFDNTGAVLVDAGRTLTRNGTYHQSGGLSRIDGTLQVIGGGSVVLEGGVLGGNGTVNSTVANDGGTVAPGDSAGALAVAGNYTQTGNGTFEVELGGSTPGIDFDTLAVGGNAALGGTISIRLLGDFMPAMGQSFVVLTAGSVSGLMGCLDADELAAGYFRVVYGDTTVTLVVATDPLVLGDLNQDGFVNGADLGLLLASWSQFPGEPGCGGDLCCPADLNGDGFVDGSDLGLLLGNWS